MHAYMHMSDVYVTATLIVQDKHACLRTQLYTDYM